MNCRNCNTNKDHGFCDTCYAPLNLEQLEDYIDYSRLIIDFFIRSRQWDGLKVLDIKKWLNNFPDNIIEKYFAIRLLNQIIYYSENDMESLLYEGIFNRIIGEEHVSLLQYGNNFSYQNQELCEMQHKELESTLFVPLLVGPDPDESGNQLTRMLTQRLLINKSRVKFHYCLNDNDALNNKRLIIVDDCLGTGQQCFDFWTKSTVKSGELLRNWCKNNNLDVYYLVLVGFLDSIDNLNRIFSDLKIRCMEVLQNTHRVFHKDSFYWEDQTELLIAKNYFKHIAHSNNFNLAGFNGLDFALALHKTIPDWSIHALWKERSNWSYLMGRKNSHV